MKMMFHKTDMEGRWFDEDEEVGNNYTEKVPPYTNYTFDEEQNEWIEKPMEIEKSEEIT
jgi:uncharacterized protein (DUF924 family)